jgi:hypothetical protein
MLTLQVLGGEAVDRPATQRDCLAAVDGELVALQAQYDLAMSGFKFDVASALQREIAVLESERRALAASLPPPAPVPDPPVGVVPVLHRSGRPRRLRRGR